MTVDPNKFERAYIQKDTPEYIEDVQPRILFCNIVINNVKIIKKYIAFC